MLNLDSTDNLEGLASVTNVIDFTFSGVDGTTLVSSEGKLSDSQTTIRTATGILRVYSLTLVNTHSAAVTVTISKDPTDAGTLYRLFSISLGIGYAALFDGVRLSVFDALGGLVAGVNVSNTAYAASWDGITTIAPSKNAVYDMALQTLLTAQGDTVYASAANTLARLAKGAANLKMFMNAAGTAPEWAVGMKIGTFSIDTATATGTQAISGVGFLPSHIIFFTNVTGTTEVSLGLDNGTVSYSLNKVSTTWVGSNTRAIVLDQGGGMAYYGYVTTLGADGFTISWTKVGAKTGTALIYYLALR